MDNIAVRHGMFAEFLEWHALRAVRATGDRPAAKTLEAKGYRLRSVAKLLGADSPICVAAELGDREKVSRLLDKLYARQKPGTMLSTVVALKQFGEYAVAMDWIPAHAVLPEDVPQRGGRQKPIEVYSQDEVDLLLLFAKVKDLRLWMFLVTLVDTGRRVGEVLGLRWDDFKFDAVPPHIDLARTKNGRQQYVPLTTRLTEVVYTDVHVHQLQHTGHPLWVRPPAEYPYPWKYQAVHGALRGLCEAAEVPFHNGLHVFRHTYATHKLAKGVPLQAVSSLLGHSGVGITDRIYNHTTALSYGQYVD